MNEELKYIRIDIKDVVANLIINKPPLNVLDIEAMGEINCALEGIKAMDDLKLLVISAEGKFFSAGVDVADHMGDKAGKMLEVFHRIFYNLEMIKCPTISVLQGSALGGGCELAIFCDMVIASEKAKIGQPEIKVGVWPPVAAIVMPAIIGKKKAFELLLTGEAIDAREAERIGLINKVIPEDKFSEEVKVFIQRLTDLSPVVLKSCKKALNLAFNKRFGEALPELEDQYLNSLMKTEDANEGLNAFLEKRKPQWKNR